MALWKTEYNQTADITYGLICLSCFLVGTFGNISSFFFFKAKKRDVSTVSYMLITGCDVVISILVLPVGISFLSERKPGLVFGNKYGCAIWAHIWTTSIALSFFLVICLSVTRTISLFRPFQRLKTRKLCISVVVYISFTLFSSLWYQIKGGTKIEFSYKLSRCFKNVSLINDNRALVFVITLIRGIVYIAPVFVVVVSCVLSMVLLRRKTVNVQQRELQQSRRRATITILLFALLYVICNIPYLLNIMVFLVNFSGLIPGSKYRFYQFDVNKYYISAIGTLLLAANSAMNPLLYLWRMHSLREYLLAKLRKCYEGLRGLASREL